MDGSFTITANITTKCGKSYDRSYTYTKKCTKATNIVATRTASLDLSLSINGNMTDITKVIWVITKSGTEIYRSGELTSTFSTTVNLKTDSTFSTFTITAQIINKCGEAYELTINYNIYTTPEILNFQMVAVEGGTFYMGSNDGYTDQQPVHSVTLSSFNIGKYEVTQAQWKAVMGTNPSSRTNCDNCPVETVSWDDIQSFLTKLNTLTGKSYRLPTEAEWEYAARGGKLSQGYTYPGSNTIDDVAWYEANSGNYIHPVGQKTANELGLYDMAGNAWERCSDWYGSYSSVNQTNPIGVSSGTHRVIRGGSCQSLPEAMRVACRNTLPPDIIGKIFGFRVCTP